jgi:hypothetical protein
LGGFSPARGTLLNAAGDQEEFRGQLKTASLLLACCTHELMDAVL